jgi:inorganic pyrophosphatase/GNAT superfamily N-acetyltransferase
MTVTFRIASAADTANVLAAFATWKYERQIGAKDTIWVAEQAEALVGLVRIAREENTFVLRGMRVDEQWRGHGIGSEMLRAVARWLGNRECYCIPYSYLVRFYGKVGFAEIEPTSAPQFLAQRLAQYRSQGLDVTIMLRSGVSPKVFARTKSAAVPIKVFVQNEAGSNLKNHHDEKTLTFRFAEHVSLPYPFPYGFVIGTTAQDGCNLDCYVITGRDIRTATIVECEPIGLMEQFEDGIEDHNVLAVPMGDSAEVSETVQKRLTEFVENVFRHMKGKQIRAGRFLSATEAKAHIESRTDPHFTN